jgi:TatA/E family protein of Tat protein translocase
MPTPGPLELVIILVIALLILGPGKLPDVGSALGKSIREFRKASSDVQDAVKVDTSPLPPPAPAASADATIPTATPARADANPNAGIEGERPAAQPAVAPTAADLPGAPTVATTSAQDSGAITAPSEPTPGRS